MAFNPYEILGVARDATPADIRAAYRQKAMKDHPDQGGDRAAFESLKRAEKILNDAARRAEYDRTGIAEDERPDNRLSELASTIVPVFDLVISEITNGDLDPGNRDVLSIVTERVSQDWTETQQKRIKVSKHIKNIEKTEARLKSKSGKGFLKEVLRGHAQSLRALLSNFEKREALLKDALDILSDHTFDWEQVMQINKMWTGFTTSTSAST